MVEIYILDLPGDAVVSRILCPGGPSLAPDAHERHCLAILLNVVGVLAATLVSLAVPALEDTLLCSQQAVGFVGAVIIVRVQAITVGTLKSHDLVKLSLYFTWFLEK